MSTSAARKANSMHEIISSSYQVRQEERDQFESCLRLNPLKARVLQVEAIYQITSIIGENPS